MELISNKTEINFMGRRKLAVLLSAVLIVVSIGSLITRGLNLGVDFTGGILVEVGYADAADLDAIRGQLSAADYEGAQVQNFGSANDVLIRMLPTDDLDTGKLGEQILGVLQEGDANVTLRRIEFVGPQVGEELTERGGTAMIFALLMILAYIMFRFQ